MASNRVDFIYKDDTRSVLFALLEEITNSRCADANEHLDEIRPADRKERHIRFTRNRAGKKSFSGTRRPNQQNAFGDSAAQFLKLLGLLQKIDDFLQLFLRFFDARNIFKCDLLLMSGQQA